uniref:Shelterin complex subunit TPP1/Est3 domain-containing protein n=1 Tax=Knipowitschia caucasica TaxID=637954 RepID=A0AAV2L4F5_KNICA
MLARCRINPWIEKLIVSFDKDESASIGSLKAHVIGVGHMSQSQALGSEGPTGLLFLSDEQVQIPAVLTASAWENLQDHEDKECFNSLLNTTVGIQDYKMQFHINTSSTKTSPEASPVQQNPIFTKAVCPLDIGSQISSHPEGSQREITAEPSLFPPFQKPIASTTSSSASANTLSSLSRVANPGCSAIQESTDGHFTQKCKGSLRCRSVDVDVSVILDEEEQKDRSPPSWLFDSQRGGTSQQNTSQTQGPPAGQTNTVYPCVHADGRPFSYTYQVRGHELLHFSSFTVQQDLQQWAVRYLLRPAHAEQIRDL